MSNKGWQCQLCGKDCGAKQETCPSCGSNNKFVILLRALIRDEIANVLSKISVPDEFAESKQEIQSTLGRKPPKWAVFDCEGAQQDEGLASYAKKKGFRFITPDLAKLQSPVFSVDDLTQIICKVCELFSEIVVTQ